jgi:hypothetical protein
MTRKSYLLLALLLVVTATAVAQRGRGGGGRFRNFETDIVDRGNLPMWDNAPRFKADIFTFVRVKYSSYDRWGKWRTDFPDSDLNFSYRLKELTALEVDPNGKVLELTDEALFDYPFLYLIEPGDMSLDEREVAGLRKYCLNGGFLMVDDFWGEREWYNFYHEIKRVFPEREPIELPLEHEIFHCVYDLKKKPQVPSIHSYWRNGQTNDGRWDAGEAHYKGIFDDKGRMMALICHNTDLGDGWEREAEDGEYFRMFSEKWSYPMGINIVTYAMTH